jgi:RNA polymerase sigma factor (TIGR02999 family)
MAAQPDDLTALLNAWSAGDPGAEGQLMSAVYPRLRRLVGRRLATRRDVTLSVTEVVHEVYLKLTPPRPQPWCNRVQFFAFAARLLRQVLVDYSRRKHGKKRNAITVPLELLSEVPAGTSFDVGILAIDQALSRLAVLDPMAARIVELRFFAGLTLEETANVVDVSRTGVVTSWRHARAWLRKELEADAPRSSAGASMPDEL